MSRRAAILEARRNLALAGLDASEADALDAETAGVASRLQLEQSAWSTHGFVEQVANQKLQMTIPSATEVRIVRP